MVFLVGGSIKFTLSQQSLEIDQTAGKCTDREIEPHLQFHHEIVFLCASSYMCFCGFVNHCEISKEQCAIAQSPMQPEPASVGALKLQMAKC